MANLSTLLFLVIACICSADAQQSTPASPTSTFSSKTLPSLPKDPLQLNVEVTVYTKNVTSGVVNQYTSYWEEYRNPVSNNGLLISFNGSMERRTYYDLLDQQAMTFERDVLTTPLNQADCKVQDLVSDSSPIGTFSFQKEGDKFVIGNISSFFGWSENFMPSYVGTDKIRGITADKWLMIQTVSGGAYQNQTNYTYYFSSGHVMPYYGMDPVPLRIEVVGVEETSSGQREFEYVYEFGLIAPLGEKEENFFYPPRGAYCVGRKFPPSLLHSFSDQYMISEEIADANRKLVENRKVFFDYTLKLTRTDIQFEAHDKYAYESLRVIHDFNMNYEIIVVNRNDTCHVTKIPTSGGISSWDISTGPDQQPQLTHTRDLPGLQNLQFQGYRVEKGMRVVVWSSRVVLPNKTVTVSEIWSTAPTWTVLSSQAPFAEHSVIAGAYIFSYDKVNHRVYSQQQVNVYDQFYGNLKIDGNFSVNVFDVPECYLKDYKSQTHLNVRVLDSDGAFLGNRVTRDSIARAVRQKIANLTTITATRIVDIEVYDEKATDGSQVGAINVYFTIRDKLLLDTAAISDIVDDETENNKVVTILEAKLTNAQNDLLSVPTKDGGYARFTIVSLLKDDDGSLAEEASGKSYDDKGNRTYSAASMAGLGIGMVILGALLAVAVGGVLWVKRFDINLPYVTQSNE
ncbi:uncharacterized protein [Watersipora subatra]|uniref:uncharacterized protein n=1 Tax=Watersipora subatra TaxID=2589382 RepID=UPI00355B2C5C